jgi:hypothetical protein
MALHCNIMDALIFLKKILYKVHNKLIMIFNCQDTNINDHLG